MTGSCIGRVVDSSGVTIGQEGRQWSAKDFSR
jgi:hypothetical protein